MTMANTIAPSYTGPIPERAHHTVVALMQDHPGVLNRVASLFRRRGFNIESLTVGHSHIPGISRMTIEVDAATTDVDQVIKQLSKLIEVVRVHEITHQPKISHELALIKVSASGSTRAEIIQTATVFHAEVLDVTPESVMIQMTGPGETINSLLELLRGYGVREMVRTGVVAMVRGADALTIEDMQE